MQNIDREPLFCTHFAQSKKSVQFCIFFCVCFRDSYYEMLIELEKMFIKFSK